MIYIMISMMKIIYKAIVFGSEYTIEAETPHGKIIWAKSPIKTDEYQQIIGVVSRIFQKNNSQFYYSNIKRSISYRS